MTTAANSTEPSYLDLMKGLTAQYLAKMPDLIPQSLLEHGIEVLRHMSDTKAWRNDEAEDVIVTFGALIYRMHNDGILTNGVHINYMTHLRDALPVNLQDFFMGFVLCGTVDDLAETYGEGQMNPSEAAKRLAHAFTTVGQRNFPQNKMKVALQNAGNFVDTLIAERASELIPAPFTRNECTTVADWLDYNDLPVVQLIRTLHHLSGYNVLNAGQFQTRTSHHGDLTIGFKNGTAVTHDGKRIKRPFAQILPDVAAIQAHAHAEPA